MFHEECRYCKAADTCPTACEYGPVMCMVKRMQSGQTKAEALHAARPKYCTFCGKPLREIGSKVFCNNVQCPKRYQDL